MKNILITGGAGYIAYSLVNLLKYMPYDIIRLDLPGAKFQFFDRNVSDARGDVRDRATWDNALPGKDVVFHLAGQTSVGFAEENPKADLEANVVPMLHLLESCKAHDWHPTIVYAGTATEVGVPGKLSVDESFPDCPMTVYDIDKLTAEKFLLYYARQGVVSGMVLRLANVYGPGPRSGSADRGVLNGWIRQALQGEALTVYGHGNYFRDYVYVEDVARAFVLAADSIGARDWCNGRYFVIGTGQGTTVSEAAGLVAERVKYKTGKRVMVIHTEPPTPLSPVDTRNFVANPDRFYFATGWKTEVNLSDGIDRTIDYYLSEGV